MFSVQRVRYPGSLPARDDGQSLIELALVLPIFLLMVFGFINFALIMFGVCNSTYACRMAIRYATVHSTTSYIPANAATLTTLVQPYIFQYPQNTYTLTLAPFSGGNPIGATAVINLKLSYNIKILGYTYNALQISTQASGVVVQ